MKLKLPTYIFLICGIGIFCFFFSSESVINKDKINAANDAVCKCECPNGKVVSCKGFMVQSIGGADNPGCKCDKKEVRCNDDSSNSNEEDGNKKKKDKKKEENKDIRPNTE